MQPPEDEVTAAAALLEALRLRGLTLATAESLTGGRVGGALTSVAGSSAVYVGGVIAYATRVKSELLGVPAELVRAHGVVSAECAEAMARGARLSLGADLAVSTTGVAGPDPQEGKPVGLVFVGVADASGSTARELRLDGGRDDVRAATVAAALALAAERTAGIA